VRDQELGRIRGNAGLSVYRGAGRQVERIISCNLRKEKMTNRQFEELKEVLRIKKTKDINGNYYYSTAWGKKTDEGLKRLVEAITKEEK